MKNMKLFKNNKIKVFGGGLSFLAFLSCFAVGFSSWNLGINYSNTEINIDSGDIIVDKSLLNDYKFTASYNSGISYITDNYYRDGQNSIENYYSEYLSVDLNVNIKNTELFFNQEYDSNQNNELNIKVIIKDNAGNVLNDSSSFLNSCFVYPKRFNNVKFNLTSKDGLDVFQMPFKSKNNLSLFHVSIYDKSYSSFSSSLYMSPVTFIFEYKSSFIQTSISRNYLFDVEFSIN